MFLYRAYFTDGLDISDRAVLADRASAAGLDRDETLRFLSGEDASRDVREELASASEIGITGVPAFVFAQKYLVPVAVDTATFVRILGEL